MGKSVGVDVKLDLSGFEGLTKHLKARNVTLAGARAGVKILSKASRAAAPKRRGSGMLKRAQGFRAKKGTKGKTISYAVQGVKKKTEKMVKLPGHTQPVKVVPAFYDHLVQGGVRPHSLAKGSRLARTAPKDKRKTDVGQGLGERHPGAKPNPYRKRAYEALKSTIGEATNAAMGKEVQKLIDAESSRIGGKGRK